MLGAMEAVFTDALAFLEELPFSHDGVAIERGRSDLTPKVQAAFEGFIQALLDAVIDFNRTSCALSNFPGGAPPGERLYFNDATRHWRRLAGVFAVREPAFAREARRHA